MRLVEWHVEPTAVSTPETVLVETTVGRALLSEILPEALPFSNINKALKKKEIAPRSTTSVRQLRPEGDRDLRRQKLLQAASTGHARRHLDRHRRHAGAEGESMIDRARREGGRIEQQFVRAW